MWQRACIQPGLTGRTVWSDGRQQGCCFAQPSGFDARLSTDGCLYPAAAVGAAVAAPGTTFDGADLTGSVWEDALIGNEDVKRLCSNPTLTGESRFQVGCRGG